jgi:hypothetical protein
VSFLLGALSAARRSRVRMVAKSYAGVRREKTDLFDETSHLRARVEPKEFSLGHKM